MKRPLIPRFTDQPRFPGPDRVGWVTGSRRTGAPSSHSSEGRRLYLLLRRTGWVPKGENLPTVSGTLVSRTHLDEDPTQDRYFPVSHDLPRHWSFLTLLVGTVYPHSSRTGFLRERPDPDVLGRVKSPCLEGNLYRPLVSRRPESEKVGFMDFVGQRMSPVSPKMHPFLWSRTTKRVCKSVCPA